MNIKSFQTEFFNQLAEPFTGTNLFDQLSDIVYFIKDSEGQYVLVNQTMVDRLNLSDKSEVIGKTPDQVYPNPLGEEYRKQDEALLTNGSPILNQLELHISGSPDLCWCITSKVPLHDRNGNIIGIHGISRDLEPYTDKNKDFTGIAQAVNYIKENYRKSLMIDDLAKMANLSTYQFEQRMQKIFKLTAGQFIQKTRIEKAIWQLRETTNPILNIALDCGYADQSAFSRQFKKTIGISPAQYRKMEAIKKSV